MNGIMLVGTVQGRAQINSRSRDKMCPTEGQCNSSCLSVCGGLLRVSTVCIVMSGKANGKRESRGECFIQEDRRAETKRERVQLQGQASGK